MITLTEILQNILKIRVNKGFSQQVVAQLNRAVIALLRMVSAN